MHYKVKSIQQLQTKKHVIKFEKIDKSKKIAIQIKSHNELRKHELNRYLDILLRYAKYKIFPLIGIITKDMIIRMKKYDKLFLIFENNFLIGFIYYQNLTYNFKKELLGDDIDDFKSKSNINNYLINWFFWSNDITPYIFNKSVEMLKKYNNIGNGNFLITRFTQLKFNSNIFFKIKPLLDYKNSEEYNHHIKLGFTYTGFHTNNINEEINIFSKRYINKVSVHDFFPLFVISRQISNIGKTKLFDEEILRLDNLISILEKNNLIQINNISKHALDNTFTLIINRDICSLNNSFPYEHNFITNFIRNDLGNSHIVKNYFFLYFRIKEYLKKEGLDNTILKKQFAEIIVSLDRVKEVFNEVKRPYVGLMSYSLKATPSSIINAGFKDADNFFEYLNNSKYNLEYGFICRSFNFLNNLLPVKSKTNYFLSCMVMFVYNNNELKTYVYNDLSLLIFKETDQDIYSNIEFSGKTFLFEPIVFNKDGQQYFDEKIDFDDIMVKFRKLALLISKIYKKEICANINQINGFVITRLSTRLIKEDNNIYPVIYSILAGLYFFDNYRENRLQIKWIYDLAISPILDDNEKNKMEYEFEITPSEKEAIKLAYQPV
jgi:hypothetical protein